MKPRERTTGSSTARKPPVPTDSHAEIEDWIRRVMPDLHPIVQELDESIRETIPGLQYAMKWKKAYYGLPEVGWVIEMVAYDVSVNVVFFGGADFEHPTSTRNHRSGAVRESEDTRRGAAASDARVDRAGRTRTWLAVSVSGRQIR